MNVIAQLMAEVTTAVKKASRLERRPRKAIGHARIDVLRQQATVQPEADLDYRVLRGCCKLIACLQAGMTPDMTRRA